MKLIIFILNIGFGMDQLNGQELNHQKNLSLKPKNSLKQYKNLVKKNINNNPINDNFGSITPIFPSVVNKSYNNNINPLFSPVHYNNLFDDSEIHQLQKPSDNPLINNELIEEKIFDSTKGYENIMDNVIDGIKDNIKISDKIIINEDFIEEPLATMDNIIEHPIINNGNNNFYNSGNKIKRVPYDGYKGNLLLPIQEISNEEKEGDETLSSQLIKLKNNYDKESIVDADDLNDEEDLIKAMEDNFDSDSFFANKSPFPDSHKFSYHQSRETLSIQSNDKLKPIYGNSKHSYSYDKRSKNSLNDMVVSVSYSKKSNKKSNNNLLNYSISSMKKPYDNNNYNSKTSTTLEDKTLSSKYIKPNNSINAINIIEESKNNYYPNYINEFHRNNNHLLTKNGYSFEASFSVPDELSEVNKKLDQEIHICNPLFICSPKKIHRGEFIAPKKAPENSTIMATNINESIVDNNYFNEKTYYWGQHTKDKRIRSTKPLDIIQEKIIEKYNIMEKMAKSYKNFSCTIKNSGFFHHFSEIIEIINQLYENPSNHFKLYYYTNILNGINEILDIIINNFDGEMMYFLIDENIPMVMNFYEQVIDLSKIKVTIHDHYKKKVTIKVKNDLLYYLYTLLVVHDNKKPGEENKFFDLFRMNNVKIYYNTWDHVQGENHKKSILQKFNDTINKFNDLSRKIHKEQLILENQFSKELSSYSQSQVVDRETHIRESILPKKLQFFTSSIIKQKERQNFIDRHHQSITLDFDGQDNKFLFVIHNGIDEVIKIYINLIKKFFQTFNKATLQKEQSIYRYSLKKNFIKNLMVLIKPLIINIFLFLKGNTLLEYVPE